MNKLNIKRDTAGFAWVEAIMIVVVLMVGAGLSFAYLNATKKADTANIVKNDQTTDKVAPITDTTTTPIITPVGSTTGITEMITSAVENEAKIDSSNDETLKTTATSDKTALTNLGGAYDTSNL